MWFATRWWRRGGRAGRCLESPVAPRARQTYDPGMAAEWSDTCPRPGAHVVAACGLPTGCRGHSHVPAGTAGEIVHTPAHFSTAYSIRFDLHGTPVTLHGINRHDFLLVDDAGHDHPPGFPPADRYPQPAPAVPGDRDASDPPGEAPTAG